ncbi:unnamed protein product [Peniophora sp. CBMAI 1063]|nr:unnamed protein product [Peniophora sp. CBMAI 1063]
MSTRPASTSTNPAPAPPRPYTVNTATKVLDSTHGRILCIADIRGRLSALNDLAREAGAQAIIHTGDFGLFEASSLDRIHDRTLRHLTMYSPLLPSAQRNHLLAPDNPPASVRSTLTINMLSEFPLLLSGQIKLQVPVYTVAGACEDVLVLEKFRTGQYTIPNLTVLDEATTRVLDVGGVKLRLLGLGGAFVPHKMFDNGDGNATIAGGGGTIWTTMLQMGELVDTAQRVFDPTETRLLVTHASPGREGLLSSLALTLKADLTMSAGLHFRYASSWNEFSVQGDYDGFRAKLRAGKDAFNRVWDSVKTQVDQVIDDNQRVLLDKALAVVDRVPPAIAQAGEEPAWKNCWNWNLCDAAYGNLVLDVRDGRVSAELKSQGFNYAYRRSATPSSGATPTAANANTALQATGTPGMAMTSKAVSPAPPAPAAPSAPSPAPPKPVSPAPAAEASTTPKTNGTSSPVEKSEKEKEKAEREKAKKKEKRDKKKERDAAARAEAASPAPAASEAAEADKPSLSVQPVDGEAPESGLMSPRTDSTGARTPTSKRAPRNPWTLFMRIPIPANEQEVREFFQDAKAGITKVHFPQSSFAGREKRLAYVEFGDEEAMKAGLEKHAEKLNDGVPDVKVADREPREGGSFRGRGRGRGGFVSRGFAAAGLARGGAPKSNGDS